MIGPNLQQSMKDYYNERAKEYEDIYIGKGYKSLVDSNAYIEDVKAVSKLIGKYLNGKTIDIACGTGYWMPYYHSSCTEIFLIDQAKKTLKECQKKIQNLDIENKCKVVCSDFFDYNFKKARFNSALVGSILSHLTEKQEADFFNKLKNILKPGAEFVILDSAWNEEKAKKRKKSGIQERPLKDGRKFKILKKYFDRNDAKVWEKKYNLKSKVFYEGRVLIGITGKI